MNRNLIALLNVTPETSNSATQSGVPRQMSVADSRRITWALEGKGGGGGSGYDDPMKNA